MRRAGASSGEIAAKLGVTRERACQYLRDAGLNARLPPKCERLAEANRADILYLWGEKCSIRQISKLLDVPVRVVSLIVGKQDRGTWSKRIAEAKFDRDSLGKRFGRLVVRKAVGMTGNHDRVVECRCDCGRTCRPLLANVKAGRTKSCGCLMRKWARGIGQRNRERAMRRP
jgi:hypothetical protein